MRHYEDLDEIEDRTPVTATREWLIEEWAVRQWFSENPRFEPIIIISGGKAVEASVEMVIEDWPDYVDFDY